MSDENLSFAIGAAVGAIGMLLFACLAADCAGERGYRGGKANGRCIELCRPEKFIELVNDNKECLCATKRVRLTP